MVRTRFGQMAVASVDGKLSGTALNACSAMTLNVATATLIMRMAVSNAIDAETICLQMRTAVSASLTTV